MARGTGEALTGEVAPAKKEGVERYRLARSTQRRPGTSVGAAQGSLAEEEELAYSWH